MTVAFEPVVTTSASQQIADQISRSIHAGQLKPGDRLPGEHELAQQFGVSRPTIREALKQLAALNLVASRRGPSGGTFITAPDTGEARDRLAANTAQMLATGALDFTDIAEARHELELVCARLAAERADAARFGLMQAELERQLDPELSDTDFCTSDTRFHRALADATGNHVLALLMAALNEALQPLERTLLFRYEDREKIVKQHQRLLSALQQADTKRAEKAVNKQMAYLRDRFGAAESLRHQGRIETAG